MANGGLTTFALVFMLLSMGSVTALMVYCFWRILTHPASPGTPGGLGGEAPGREGGGA